VSKLTAQSLESRRLEVLIATLLSLKETFEHALPVSAFAGPLGTFQDARPAGTGGESDGHTQSQSLRVGWSAMTEGTADMSWISETHDDLFLGRSLQANALELLKSMLSASRKKKDFASLPSERGVFGRSTTYLPEIKESETAPSTVRCEGSFLLLSILNPFNTKRQVYS
jgi:hypothetical protein